MKIIRRIEYIAMPVRALRDGELSLRSKGMLAVLFTLPDGGTLTEYELAAASQMTLEDTSEVVRELERAGYLVREGDALRMFDAPLDGLELEFL